MLVKAEMLCLTSARGEQNTLVLENIAWCLELRKQVCIEPFQINVDYFWSDAFVCSSKGSNKMFMNFVEQFLN